MDAADRQVWAHVDESFPQLPSGRFLYALANVVTDVVQRGVIRGELQALAYRDGLRAVHFADENRARRVALAKQVAGLELLGTIVVTQIGAAQKLEDCRSRLLTAAAARLQRVEHVSRLVMESRSQADKNDRKTIDIARSRRHLSGRLTIDFARKSTDPVLWVADVIVSAFTVAEKGGDPEPGEVLNDGQVIDVQRLQERGAPGWHAQGPGPAIPRGSGPLLPVTSSNAWQFVATELHLDSNASRFAVEPEQFLAAPIIAD